MKFKNKSVKRITYDINSAVNLSLDLKNTKMKKVASINQKLKRSNTIDFLRSNEFEKVVFQFKRRQDAVAMAQIPKDKKFDIT